MNITPNIIQLMSVNIEKNSKNKYISIKFLLGFIVYN